MNLNRSWPVRLAVRLVASTVIAFVTVQLLGHQGGSLMSPSDKPLALSSLQLPAGMVDSNAKVASATVLAFTEGPAADASGNIYFSDIINSRIMRLSATGQLTVFR